jgi:hypothetical protein
MTRLARYPDAARIAAFALVRKCLEFSDTRLGELLLRLSPRNVKQRPRQGPRWFTADESALVKILANLIVPSDDTGPGAAQLAVAGRPAVETLDRLVAGSRPRQAVYARGLPALDRLAKDAYRSKFADLSQPDQVRLLQVVDRVGRKWAKPDSLASKIGTRIVILYHKWSGLYPAVELFRTLVQDVLQTFYTDPLSWAWLDYDGPPMPEGYPGLVRRR